MCYAIYFYDPSLVMAEVVVEVMGLVLAILGWCLESSSTNSAVWRVNSHAGTVITSSSQYEGLWTTCAANSMGAVQCQRYKTILGLPGEFYTNTHTPRPLFGGSVFLCMWQDYEICYYNN